MMTLEEAREAIKERLDKITALRIEIAEIKEAAVKRYCPIQVGDFVRGTSMYQKVSRVEAIVRVDDHLRFDSWGVDLVVRPMKKDGSFSSQTHQWRLGGFEKVNAPSAQNPEEVVDEIVDSRSSLPEAQ